MKKLFVVMVLTFALGAAYSQNFGIQAGTSFYSGKATFNNSSLKYDTKTGFTAGIVYFAPVGSRFAFMPSLNYTQKGGTYATGNDGEDKLTLSYIELPLNFVFNAAGKGGSFFLGAGPDIGFGVGGTRNFQGVKRDIIFGTEAADDFKPFEFSVNVIAGYKFNNGLFLAGNYNPGVTNIVPDNSSGDKYHNMGFSIRIGYLFGGGE